VNLCKVTSMGLCVLMVAGSAAPLAAARGGRRTSVSRSSRTAVSTSRSGAAGHTNAATVTTRRTASVSTASRSAVRHGASVSSRSYVHRGVTVWRPHGQPYHGYGNYHNDNDAWKWLAFTAITLKILDNISEEQQRQHEAAQVEATTAPVGQPITWNDGDANGSVTTTREGMDASGLTCREFQQEVTIGGETEQAVGTACLQADGSWKISE